MEKNLVAENYNKHYRHNPEVFGSEPESFVLEAASMIPVGSKIIEIGAGQGRNAIALAEKGFNVTATDISQVGVDLINKKSKELGLSNLQAKVSDSLNTSEEKYELIVCTFVLHQLTKKKAYKLITEIKEHTKTGGINSMAIFTSDGDFASVDTKGNFYPTKEEILKIYEGWEILNFTERNTKARQKDDEDNFMFNKRVELIARKLN